MSLEEQLDQVEQALGDLAQQYKGLPVFEAMLSSYIAQVQEMEGVAFDIYNLLDVDANVGEQLDLVGRIVGQPRNGFSDVIYRQQIKARSVLNRGSGRGEDIIAITDLLVLPRDFTYTEYDTIQVLVVVQDELDGEVGLALASILQDAKAGGVRIQAYWHSDDDGTFRFSDTDDTKTDAVLGLGDDTLGDVGGLFSSAK